MNNPRNFDCISTRTYKAIFSSAVLILFCCSILRAQNDTYTPMGLKPGSPAGSYALSDLDNVNLFNGSVNVRIPLYQHAGRGQAKSLVNYTWDSPMRWQIYKSADSSGNTIYGSGESPSHPDGSVSYGLHSGEISVYAQGVGTGGPSWCQEGYEKWDYTLTRFFWVEADGTEHEMRDVLNGGKPLATAGCFAAGPNRGRVFVSTDGSGATFVTDSVVRDGVYAFMEFPYNEEWAGWLLLKDGRRIRISWDNNRGIRDRNGNLLSTIANQPVKDSLNRSLGSGYATSPECPSGCSYLSYKGFSGNERKLQFATDAAYRNEKIFLPNGTYYRFYYNFYGDLLRLDLPTGGSIEYDYGPGLTGSQPDFSYWIYGAPPGTYGGGPSDFHIYRRVTERRVYREGHILESRQTFSQPEDVNLNNLGYVDKKEYDANGNLLGTERHYFYGSAEHSFWLQPTQYSAWKDGKEYRTEFYDAYGNLLRKVEHTWEQRASVGWWTGSPDDAPTNDPRVSQTVMFLENGASSTTSYSYDPTVPYNSLTDVYQRDYNGALLRRTQTTYLKILNGINYIGSNIQDATALHLRDFPLQVSVYDGGGTERARTTYEYDNYNTDANHAPLLHRSGISGLDTSFSTSYTKRGNVTGTTNYLLTNGSITGSVSSYAQYDIAGNVVKSIDPRGYATYFYYADCFGSPANAEARANTAPSELAGQTSFAFPTIITNDLGQTVYAQFDFNLGRAVEIEDTNGVVSSGYFNDPLDRPTQAIRGANQAAVKTQTSFAYDDASRTSTATGDQTTYNDNALKSQTAYDGLGRTTETRTYEGGANYIAVRQVPFTVLQDGTNWVVASQASNPFRPYLGEQPVWTTSYADALGRNVKIKTPDNAVITSSYSGDNVTVVDQAGKQRKSVADALGRSIAVYEAPNDPSYNYATTYSYDALDNLTHVSQGSQTRTFVYDSLKRLKSATNPENGTVTYQYDNNGNLIQRTDARTSAVTTNYVYDALNRVTSKSYNDSPQTPSVNYFYDAQTLPSGAPSYDRGASTGRLVAVTYGGSEGTYRGYDAMGRVIREYQRTDSINYLVEAGYNRASAMSSQTYPSVPGAGDRRTVTYTPDGAGRLASLSSNATSYAAAATLSGVSYKAHGGLDVETLGNGLIHQQGYNIRLQTTAVKLGTSGNPTSVLNLTCDYGTTDNNGNVKNCVNTIGSLAITDTFTYDPVNRLLATTETSTGGSGWTETNDYDRYGNRRVNLGGGNYSLSFSTSTNRITGKTYDGAGNLTVDGGVTFGYDAENHLVSVNSVTGYKYDGEGRRVRKLTGENTRFIYDISGELIAEFSGAAGVLQKEYVLGGGMTAVIEPSVGTRYTTSDHLGSPRVVANSSGGVVSRHDYRPFGDELFAGTSGRTTAIGYGSADGVRQKFTGYQHDAETGLDFAQARYFSSVQGRFTGADPVSGQVGDPQTWNMYSYVGNNPMNRIDPTGMSYFMGSGANDPFIRENAYRVDGFDMSPEGTASQLTSESMLTYSPNQFLLNEGMLSFGVSESADPEPQGQGNPDDYRDWVVTNVRGLEGTILRNDATDTPWDGYRDVDGTRGCAQLPQMWDFHRQGQPIDPRRSPNWRMGREMVWGNAVTRGTVVATFNRTTGQYENRPAGNHTAIFLSWYQTRSGQRGMWVVEQGPNWRPRGRQIPFDSSAVYHSNAGSFNVVQIRRPR